VPTAICSAGLVAGRWKERARSGERERGTEDDGRRAARWRLLAAAKARSFFEE
jgi:hypothetical protein